MLLQINLDSSAKPTQSTPLTWSDPPIAVEHVHPYMLGLLPKLVLPHLVVYVRLNFVFTQSICTM